MSKIFQTLSIIPITCVPRRAICLTVANLRNNIEWRRMRGLPENPNRISALLDGPDYTFVDGRPTPYGTRQRQRMEKQKEYTARIIKLSKEVDFAVERHNRILDEERQQREAILSSKLKEKGKKQIS